MFPSSVSPFLCHLVPPGICWRWQSRVERDQECFWMGCMECAEQAPTGSCAHCTAQGAPALLVTALSPGELADLALPRVYSRTQSCSGLMPMGRVHPHLSECRALRLCSLPCSLILCFHFLLLHGLQNQLKLADIWSL